MKKGVYKITNKLNGKFYIGSSINIEVRFYQHISNLKRNTHCSKYLQNTYNKYGNVFEFTILELEDDELKLRNKEQYYIDLYKPYIPSIGYNNQKLVKNNYIGDKTNIKYKNILLIDVNKNILKSYTGLKYVSKDFKITQERARQILISSKYSKKIKGFLINYEDLENFNVILPSPTVKELEILKKLSKKSEIKLIKTVENTKLSNEELKNLERKRLKSLYNQLVSRKNKNNDEIY